MSSKSAPEPIRGWSIVRRLTGLYVSALFGMLVLSTAFLYWSLKRNLEEEDHELLADKINVFRFVLRERPNDLDALREEVEWESAARRFSKYYSRVLDQNGSTVMATPGMDKLVPAGVFPAPLSAGQSPARGLAWRSPAGNSYLLAAAWAQVGRKGQEERLQQIALDVTPEDVLLADYRAKLAAVLFAGLIISAGAGMWIARTGLRPLAEITGAVQRITATELGARLSPNRWPKELVTLATEFDRMLGRLEDSFNRLSRFSADLAHELRTPIHNLMGEAEVALSRTRSSEDYREVLESSLEEGQRLSRMIDSLLFLARAENAETRLGFSLVNVRNEMQAVVDYYDAVIAENQLEVHCEGQARLRADSILFRRALTNLLSNAVRHTPAGGRITLSARETADGAAEISVTDSGSGIPAAHLPRVFDRFYRVDPARADSAKGTGLGLAIVKSIMDLHGGTVTVESGPRDGTTACLHFPARPATADE